MLLDARSFLFPSLADHRHHHHHHHHVPVAANTNVTGLAMRSMEIDFNCNTAEYKTDTLYDFVYTHNCFPSGWERFLELEAVKKEIKEISPILANDPFAQRNQIEPPMPDIFNAFQNIGLGNIKVVILGQDPTPQAGQATGMAFSLKPGVDPRTVPSVFNMLVELKWEGAQVGLSNGDLTPWRNQGVLLLNAALTVRQGSTAVHAGVHQRLWEDFTKLLFQYISNEGPSTAWLLWGGEAQKFAPFIENQPADRHYIKTGGHPSPQGATGFFGGNYFHCANLFLNDKNRGGINWQLAPYPAAPSVAMAQC